MLLGGSFFVNTLADSMGLVLYIIIWNDQMGVSKILLQWNCKSEYFKSVPN